MTAAALNERAPHSAPTAAADSVFASPRMTAQRQAIRAVGAASPGAVVQLQKVDPLPEMQGKVRESVDILNMLHDSEVSASMVPIVVNALNTLESSEYKVHYAPLTGHFRNGKLPPSAFEAKLPPVALGNKKIHSIWVQGDVSEGGEELRQGMESRKDSGAEDWLNLIWVYQDALQQEDSADIQGMKCRPIVVHGVNLHQVDFKASMAAWAGRPDWVTRFLPLLDILLEKKSYVAMSDIMRMIILYYQGGLYQDVKIRLDGKNAKFFDEPLVNAGKLQLADGGANKENWAMVAEASCKMIEDIMEATLARFPSAAKLTSMPVNYANDGKYGKAHATLHENKGPWNQIEKFSGKTERIGEVNESLKLTNPRPVNSWADNDGVDFDWDS